MTRKSILSALTLLLTSLPSNTFSQSRPTGATDVTKADIEAVLKHVGPQGVGVDRQIKVVDAGKYNVGVGILQRGATKDGSPVTGISHAAVTEVYYVISGSGTLVTGGTILDPKPFPSEGEIVKVAVGPSVSGTLQGGERRPVSAGDVVVIPAGVPHGFSEIKDHVNYLSIRQDGEHVLPSGYVHPALKK